MEASELCIFVHRDHLCCFKKKWFQLSSSQSELNLGCQNGTPQTSGARHNGSVLLLIIQFLLAKSSQIRTSKCSQCYINVKFGFVISITVCRVLLDPRPCQFQVY